METNEPKHVGHDFLGIDNPLRQFDVKEIYGRYVAEIKCEKQSAEIAYDIPVQIRLEQFEHYDEHEVQYNQVAHDNQSIYQMGISYFLLHDTCKYI